MAKDNVTANVTGKRWLASVKEPPQPEKEDDVDKSKAILKPYIAV